MDMTEVLDTNEPISQKASASCNFGMGVSPDGEALDALGCSPAVVVVVVVVVEGLGSSSYWSLMKLLYHHHENLDPHGNHDHLDLLGLCYSSLFCISLPLPGSSNLTVIEMATNCLNSRPELS